MGSKFATQRKIGPTPPVCQDAPAPPPPQIVCGHDIFYSHTLYGTITRSATVDGSGTYAQRLTFVAYWTNFLIWEAHWTDGDGNKHDFITSINCIPPNVPAHLETLSATLQTGLYDWNLFDPAALKPIYRWPKTQPYLHSGQGPLAWTLELHI